MLGIEGSSDHLVRLAIVLVLIFPPTFVFGMLFPINLKLYCGDVSGVRKRVGEAYAINTLASSGTPGISQSNAGVSSDTMTPSKKSKFSVMKSD